MAYFSPKKPGALKNTKNNMKSIFKFTLCAAMGWFLSLFLLSALWVHSSTRVKGNTVLWIETHLENPKSWILGWILLQNS